MTFLFWLPRCILLLVAELPLTCAKLKSIPFNRARGPLNDLRGKQGARFVDVKVIPIYIYTYVYKISYV